VSAADDKQRLVQAIASLKGNVAFETIFEGLKRDRDDAVNELLHTADADDLPAVRERARVLDNIVERIEASTETLRKIRDAHEKANRSRGPQFKKQGIPT